MNLIRSAIENPVKVAVVVLLCIMFGAVSLREMPIQLLPEVDIPRINVITLWPGASPLEVEREIIDDQEEQLNSVEGLVDLQSFSASSTGTIVLEFPVGTDVDSALLLVNNKLSQVSEYPPNADKPIILNSDDSNNRPIAWFMIHYRHGFEPTMPIAHQRTFAQNVIEAEMEKIEGVASANVFGGQERRLEVIFDPEELAAREITVPQLRDALAEHNKDTSAGDFWEGKRRYVVRTLGQFRSPEQVEGVIITRRDGQPVYVRDVARVRIGHKKPEGTTRQKGEATMAMNVLRSNGSNVLEVMDRVKERVIALNEGILKDRGLELVQVYDETEYVNSSIDLVWSSMWQATIVTVLVLLAFLRKLGPTMVISVTIPACAVTSFIILYVTGRTLNVISLAGLAFAIGMVVDNAVVVMENIYRHYEMGKPRLRAALDGTNEVWGAVLASTLTTLAVFVPIVFVQEEAGQLFKDVAIAISCAVGLSLVASVLVIPVAAPRLLARRSPTDAPVASGRDSFFLRGLTGLNEWIQGSSLRRLATVVFFLTLSAGGSYWLWPGAEYLPAGNRNLITGLLMPPPGYSLDELDRIATGLEEKLRPYWGADSVKAREEGLPGIAHQFIISRGPTLFIGIKSVDEERAAELIPLLKEVSSDIPGCIRVINQSSLFGRSIEGGRSLDIEISGDSLPKLIEMGNDVFSQLQQMTKTPGHPLFDAQVRPIPSLDLSNPEVHIVPRWEQSADLGISAQQLGYVVDALVDGAYAGDYYDQNDKIDLELVSRQINASSYEQLDQLYLSAAQGELVPLAAVAEKELASGPEQVVHRQRFRNVTIQVMPSLKVPLETARTAVLEEIVQPIRESGVLESGRYQVNVTGAADKLTQAWMTLRFNLLLALLITYLLMAGLFESWLYPLVIMTTVPLGAVGGLAALWVTNWATTTWMDRPTTLDVLTMLGFVILIGTVVNNPILIVHQALNDMRERGIDYRQAVVDSARTRVRPILMTTGTTVLGLLPLVVTPGAGSEIYRGLGAAVLGGLVASTAFTMILVPAFFTLTLDVVVLIQRSLGLPIRLVPSKIEDEPARAMTSIEQ